MSFSDTELAVVRTAAEREGMASAAWAGRQVMAVAQHTLVPVSRDAGDVLRELIAARVHLRETVTALRALAAPDPPAAGLPATAADIVARALDAVAQSWTRRTELPGRPGRRGRMSTARRSSPLCAGST
ncbi:hypothetical protein ACN6AT_37450 (plasmid) [Streptomyces sp. JL4002]|uniref:hypothetical protein n=1 Tax=Streptomyces sp. JL4002 TaxID=3404781 RepID=UPI003B27F3B3